MLLKINDTGSLVEALQLALYRSGYLSEPPDGIFGKQTQQALLGFQRAFGLTEDAVAGKETFSVAERFLKGYYTKVIKSGDTLWQIAVSNGISPQNIITANPNINPDRLSVGEKITVPYAFRVVPTEVNYSSYLTKMIVDGLVARYPFAEKTDIASSVMGNSLGVMKIGNGVNSVFVSAGIHANESLNIPVVLKFTEEYLRAKAERVPLYGANTEALYSDTTFYLLPLANPDGLDLVTGALTSGEYYDNARKIAADYPNIPFPDGWQANINGIDLNLQFPADWERAKLVKAQEGFSSPSPTEFPGFEPISQPESKALFDFTKENDFKIIAAYHSQGNLIYWKYDGLLPENSERIGNILSAASGYPLATTPDGSDFAGYKDWFIKEFDRPGYTIETGLGTNPLPLSQFDEIYEANKNLLVALLEETAKF